MDKHAASIDYLRLLRRVVANRWRIIVAGFAAVVLPTLVWTVFATDDTYEASATLFLTPEKSDPVFLRDFITPEVSALYQVILKSRSLAQGVFEALPKESRDELSRRMGVRDYMLVAMNQVRRWRGQEVVVYSPSEQAIRELQETRMSFNIAKDGTVTVVATAYSPRVAVDLANTYVDVLLSRSGQFARQQARGTRELLESLLVQAKNSQTEAEDAMRKFQAQSGTPIKLPDESRADLQRLAQLEGQLVDVQVGREIAQNRLAYLKGDRKAGAQAAADAFAAPLRERMTQLEAKLVALNEKYTEQHPLVQAARNELADAQERLKAALQGQQMPRPGGMQVTKPLESAQLAKQMADLEVEIISLSSKEEGLQQRLARVKKSMASLGTREMEYAGLARGVETQNKLTSMLAEKLTAARISEQTQIRGIQIIDPATMPKQPSPKQQMKLILLGLLGGLGFGLGAAILLEYVSQVVESEQEVAAATGLSVLGSIPIAATPTGQPTLPGVPITFVATHEPHSLPADACRAIRTAIDCIGLDTTVRTLIVTSPGAGDGKSTVLLNLALAFVETGRRVIIIDADLRRPSLHRAAGVPNELGLSDALKGNPDWRKALRRVAPGLQLLTSGGRVQNPGSLLSSHEMKAVLEHTREIADVVLIDTPPVLAVSDCLPLTRQVDGVILVARFGATHRRSLVRTKQTLERVGARLVGAVINGLSPRETRRYYAEYEHYVGTPRNRTKKGKRTMKSLFRTKLIVTLALLGIATTAVAQTKQAPAAKQAPATPKQAPAPVAAAAPIAKPVAPTPSAPSAVDTVAPAAPADYRIGTEDVLHVIVWDNKDLEQTVTVRPDGKISYPLAGEIQAQGLTVPELTEILKQRLGESVKTPNVSVMVKEIKSFRVHFVGKVTKPGVYPIKAGTPLLQALTLAGGPTESADLPAAYIIRGDEKMPVDLRKLIQDGDLTKNVKLQREDTIVIPEIAIGSNPQEMLDRRIYLLGKVTKPGVYTIKQDVPILHALFLAGGAAEGGDLANAFVIRGKERIPVDLWRLIQKGDTSQNVMIKSEDTIVVPAGGELQNAVYIMGEVAKPGVYSQPEALSLLRLVTLAGGFTKYAAPARATLIRRDGDKKVLMKVDLKDVMKDPKANEDISLRPGDVLIVPERIF
jgi:polysaccharide biosynthesis transport protein